MASTGLKYWVSASSRLGDHENKWHKEAVDKCHDFIETMKDLSGGIDAKMNLLEAKISIWLKVTSGPFIVICLKVTHNHLFEQ